MPLEHEWAALPVALRRRYCACMTKPSKAAFACDCRTWKYQHFCSIYTMKECGTLEFDLRVKHTSQRWWSGILWCSTPDGFQNPLTCTSTAHIDSLRDLGQLYVCLVTSDGFLECMTRTDEGIVRGLLFDECRALGTRLKIRLVILDDGSGLAVEFIIKGVPTKTLYVGHALVSGLVPRPFVQFEIPNSTSPASCVTIETPLH